MTKQRLQREELYHRVWSSPLRTVAGEIGVSDVALRKHCRKLDVPVPGLGYWAKKEAGHRVKQTPLPKAKAGTPQFTEVGIGGASSPPPAPTEGPVWEQQAFEDDPANRVVVSDDLDRAPRAVRHTRATLRQAKPDERGIVKPYGADCLDVAVTRENVDRALRIFAAFLRACEARGFAVTFSKDGRPGTSVMVLDTTVSVRIEEPTTRHERKAANPPRRPDEYAPPLYPRYEYSPTGRLVFRIVEPYLGLRRAAWSDGDRQRVETCLNEVMVGLVEAAELKRRAREAAEERQRKWAEEAKRRAMEAEVRAREERRRQQLVRDADAWHTATRLRAFARAAEDAAQAQGTLGDLDPWLQWVRAVADDVDPLTADDIAAHLQRSAEPHWGVPRPPARS